MRHRYKLGTESKEINDFLDNILDEYHNLVDTIDVIIEFGDYDYKKYEIVISQYDKEDYFLFFAYMPDTKITLFVSSNLMKANKRLDKLKELQEY